MLIWVQVAEWPLIWNELFTQVTVISNCNLFAISVISNCNLFAISAFFYFGIQRKMLVLIVPVPGHCSSFTSASLRQIQKGFNRTKCPLDD